MTPLRKIKNLRAQTAQPFDPSTWVCTYPPQVTSKTHYRNWCNDITTDHAFISGVEGSNPNGRVTRDNPPHKIHALIVDYDAPVDWPTLPATLAKKAGGGPIPTYACESWSGHLRLVWVLDEPAIVSEDTAEQVLDALAAAVNAKKLHAGYDATSTNPSQYFAAGDKWLSLHGSIDAITSLAAAVKVGPGKRALTDTDIPLEVVAEEVTKRFGGRWPGAFEEGARGPLFWLDDGIDRPGCVVKAEGMLCYSDRAGSPFVTWREIFGPDFVKAYETKKIGGSVGGIYFDGRNFWITDDRSACLHSRENIVLHLRMLGLSADRKKGQKTSEVDQALHHIVMANRVDGAAPYVFRRERVLYENDGRRMLNTSRSKALEPADNGDPSHWPWLHTFFTSFFDPVADELGNKPLDFFYAWLARSYHAAYDKQQLSGQAVIIAGPPRRGKTLLSQFIVGNLLGGHADASDFLATKTQFNKSLSEVPLWTIDDAVSATNFGEHRKFVEALKKMVANPRIQVEPKFTDRIDVPWYGRIIITLNEDSNSLAMIPSLESSNRDKLMAFKIADGSYANFLPNRQQEELILRELPHFARFLYDYSPSIGVVGSARYGVRSYFHPLVENNARDSSTRQGSTELLDIFFKYFAEANPKIDVWAGTTTELLVELNKVEELRTFSLTRDPSRFLRDLASAEEYAKSNPHVRKITSQSTGNGRIWSIAVHKPL